MTVAIKKLMLSLERHDEFGAAPDDSIVNILHSQEQSYYELGIETAPAGDGEFKPLTLGDLRALAEKLPITHRLHKEVRGYLDVEVFGHSVEDCIGQFERAIRARGKKGSFDPQDDIDQVTQHPDLYVEELRARVRIDYEDVS